jgi:hypothetical protein
MALSSPVRVAGTSFGPASKDRQSATGRIDTIEKEFEASISPGVV